MWLRTHARIWLCALSGNSAPILLQQKGFEEEVCSQLLYVCMYVGLNSLLVEKTSYTTARKETRVLHMSHARTQLWLYVLSSVSIG